MKRLLLLRHAKTEDINKDTPADRERVLTERGRRDAPRVGRAMDVKGYVPDLILCSPSTRTRQTLELAAAEFGGDVPTEFVEEIYDARASELMGLLRDLPANVARPLLVGHNPGFEDLARALVKKSGEPGARALVAALKEKFPTCALAVIDFDIENWDRLAPSTGELHDFIRPKDLD
jgi:phosphohistidine phosphatase